MAINVYLDESGTHGDQSPVTIMASFLATAARWDAYEAEFQALLDEFGVKTFHAKKLRQSKGDFKGWTVEQKAKFNSRFLQMADEYLERGFCVILPMEDYSATYRAKGGNRKARLDTAYGLCFRICVWNAMAWAKDRRDEWPITMVLEDGHRNASDTFRILREERGWLDEPFKDLLGPLSFGGKDNCLPIAAADMLAYSMFRSHIGLTSHPLDHVVPAGPADPPYIVYKMPMRRYVVTHEMLEAMRTEATTQSWRLRLSSSG